MFEINEKIEWSTTPPEFASYVHDVRFTWREPLLYIYIHYGVKRLEPTNVEIREGDLIVVSQNRENVIWPEPWATPDFVELRISLNLPPERFYVAMHENSRYEIGILLIDQQNPIAVSGEKEISRANDMPPDYLDKVT